MAVLSIQSRVVRGAVGNSIAQPALQLMGIEVWAVDTVTLAHHPGHGRWVGRRTPPEDLAVLIEGVEALGGLESCRALLTGYFGEPGQVAVAAAAIRRLKAADPTRLYLLDPVIGDDGKGVYVAPGVAEAIRGQLLPLADIATPNRFELAWLTGRPAGNTAEAAAAAQVLRAAGPAIVLVTSVPLADETSLGTLLLDGDGAGLATVPKLAGPAEGAGDLLAAGFLGRLLQGAAPQAAAGFAVAAVRLALDAAQRGRDIQLAALGEALAGAGRVPAVMVPFDR